MLLKSENELQYSGGAQHIFGNGAAEITKTKYSGKKKKHVSKGYKFYDSSRLFILWGL